MKSKTEIFTIIHKETGEIRSPRKAYYSAGLARLGFSHLPRADRQSYVIAKFTKESIIEDCESIGYRLDELEKVRKTNASNHNSKIKGTLND